MAANGKTGGGKVPDAWNDEDWGETQKQSTVEPTDKVEEPKSSTPSTSATPTIILAKKPAPSSTPTAEEVTTHMQNMQIWNAANEGGGFDVVGNSVQPAKTLYRPELKILKRATATNSPERDPNKQGSGTPKSETGSETEGKKETPQEKMERERKEKEERYAKARERLFGPDNSANGGSTPMEKNTSSSGKNSGTATPTGAKSSNQKNTSSRKTSPSSKQRRRDRIDDDFVPRSAMVAGTLESYHLDQQLQVEAQMRHSFPQNMPQPQYMGYQPPFTSPPPPGNFGYNNQSVFPPQNPQTQPFTGHQNMNFPQRSTPNPSGSPWNSGYSSPGLQPQQNQYSQFQGQNQHPMPYQGPQNQQISSQNYQNPYMPPFQPQLGPGSVQNQNFTQQPGGLYDPNYSQKPPGHLQFYGQSNQSAPTTHYPVREPKAPDGTGRGGFGFTARGGHNSTPSNSMPPHPPQIPQGRGFPSPMYPVNSQQSQQGQNGGFNSPAAAAPWGVTSPIGTQRSPGQIWNNGPNGNNMNESQTYSGPPLMGSGYSGLGQNNVWGNSGTWNSNGGQGVARGKR
ncbi:hypothetical protein ABW19_dt0210256 [Dactylella cylindrospora]|nr:hypothetical protein ABW19_dt0210256 [Dactylella cylindrospora]